jgi:hypothetical protein
MKKIGKKSNYFFQNYKIGYIFFLVYYRIFRPNIFFYLFCLFWFIYGIRIINDTTTSAWQLGRSTGEYFLFAFVLCFLCSIPFFVSVRYPLKRIENWAFYILIVLNILGLYNNLNADNIFVERLGGNEKLNPIAFGMQAALLIIVSLIKLINSRLGLLKFSFLLINLSEIGRSAK